MSSAPPPPVAHRVEIEAPAKVNLVLRVLERDETTGYHRLETVFQALDLTDRLVIAVTAGEIEGGGARARPLPSGGPGPNDGAGGADAPEPPRTAVDLNVVGADVGPVEENLVTRAARAFLRRSGAAAGLRMRLEKRIPAGSGLGGGSSDAAAALRALNALFDHPLGGPDLRDIAASLGSDVPFFLCGSPTAVGWGRGDRLRPVPALPGRPVLLVLPGVHVATREAYEALDRARHGSGEGTGAPVTPDPGGGSAPAAAEAHERRPAGSPGEAVGGVGPALEGLRGMDWGWVADHTLNDFEAVVPAAHPDVARALAAVRATDPRVVRLAGSGSAVFGVYDGADRAAAADVALRERGHEVVETRTVERMPEPVLERGDAVG